MDPVPSQWQALVCNYSDGKTSSSCLSAPAILSGHSRQGLDALATAMQRLDGTGTQFVLWYLESVRRLGVKQPVAASGPLTARLHTQQLASRAEHSQASQQAVSFLQCFGDPPRPEYSLPEATTDLHTDSHRCQSKVHSLTYQPPALMAGTLS